MACMGKCSMEDRRRSVSRRRFYKVLGDMGLDVPAAAELFGCSRSKVYGVLNGWDRLTMDVALVLRERYGVPAEWLFAFDVVKPNHGQEANSDRD